VADRHQTLAAAWWQYGRASPLLCPVGPRRARERLQHPSVCPLPPSAFIPLSATSFVVRSTHNRSSSGSSPPSLAGHQLEPPRFSTTATTPPSPQILTALALAAIRASKASAPRTSFVGASPPRPSPWLERHRPPFHALACALSPSWVIDSRPSLNLHRRDHRRRSAVVRLRRASLHATTVLSSDDRLGQVGQ